MKPNKGFITVLMMVLISISLSTFSRAAFDTFSDVPNDSPFHESIFYLAERGIVCGEGNGRYVPDAPVTVRQWATMLCRALGDADPLNYDDDCIRQGYSDGWLEMTAITAPDSDLCRYAIYKSGFAAIGVDLYSLQLYPNEGKLSQQSEVLRAAADFGLCEDACDGTEIITRGEAAELLYALLTKTFAVVPPPMLDNIPLDNKAGVALNNYLLEIQKIPESMMQSFAEKDWRYVIDFDYLAKLSKKYDLGCTGATVYEGRKIIVSYTPSLSFMDSGDDGVVTTLRIEVKHLDPEKLMDELGFDDEARQWAGALYETLEESDAINKYKSYYEAYQPGYGGDGSYSGDVEYGSGYDNKIDISGFVDPSTKNNLDLASYAIQAWANNWGYVWGTYGNVLTPALFEYKKQQYPDGVGNYADFIKDHWLGRRTADCIGLIKGYGWLDTKSMTIRYATNGMPDYGADQMYQACKNAGTLNKDYGAISTMPEIPGLMLWKSGHAGVYIGGGYAIEAMGTSKGVVKTKVSDRNWQGWGKLPYIDYREGN